MGADEQLGRDLSVGLALGGEPGDLLLLRGELVTGFRCSCARVFARGQQLDPRTVRECGRSHRFEDLVGGSEMYPCVAATARPPQPFAVEQMRARQLGRQAGMAEVVERFAIESLGRVVGGEQRTGAEQQTERPGRAARIRPFAEAIQRGPGGIFIAGADGRLDHIGESVCPEPENVLLKDPQRVQASLLVAAKAEFENREQVLDDRHAEPLAAGERLGGDAVGERAWSCTRRRANRGSPA